MTLMKTGSVFPSLAKRQDSKKWTSANKFALAKQELHSAQYATYKSTQIKNVADSREKCQQVGIEVMEMIAKVRERKGRLDLSIVSGKHLRRISDRTATELAYAEVISYNKKNLERELQNESRQHNMAQCHEWQGRTKRREEEI